MVGHRTATGAGVNDGLRRTVPTKSCGPLGRHRVKWRRDRSIQRYNGLRENSLAASEQERPGTPANKTMLTPHVLIVDDAAFARDIIKKAMRSRFPHFKLEEAVNGKQAQARLQQGTYHLVLCDWEMPEMAGDELLTWTRQNPKFKDIPFILITSRGDKENVVRAIGLGVSNYIVKPFTTDKFLDVVTEVLVKSETFPKDSLRPSGGDQRRGMVNQSVDVLLQAQAGRKDPPTIGLSGAVPIAARVDSPTPAATEQPTDQKVKVTRKLIAQIRFGSSMAKCLIKEIGPQEVTAVIRRDGEIPAILDLAVLDFDNVEGGGASRVNAYVHRLEARDSSHETEFLNVTLRFIDDDPEKRSQIIRLIGAVRS